MEVGRCAALLTIHMCFVYFVTVQNRPCWSPHMMSITSHGAAIFLKAPTTLFSNQEMVTQATPPRLTGTFHASVLRRVR
jgi:hypothetical protein